MYVSLTSQFYNFLLFLDFNARTMFSQVRIKSSLSESGTFNRRFGLRQDGQLHHEDGHEVATAHPPHVGGTRHQRQATRDR